jgi:hypothetical protein
MGFSSFLATGNDQDPKRLLMLVAMEAKILLIRRSAPVISFPIALKTILIMLWRRSAFRCDRVSFETVIR